MYSINSIKYMEIILFTVFSIIICVCAIKHAKKPYPHTAPRKKVYKSEVGNSLIILNII